MVDAQPVSPSGPAPVDTTPEPQAMLEDDGKPATHLVKSPEQIAQDLEDRAIQLDRRMRAWRERRFWLLIRAFGAGFIAPTVIAGVIDGHWQTVIGPAAVALICTFWVVIFRPAVPFAFVGYCIAFTVYAFSIMQAEWVPIDFRPLQPVVSLFELVIFIFAGGIAAYVMQVGEQDG